MLNASLAAELVRWWVGYKGWGSLHTAPCVVCQQHAGVFVSAEMGVADGLTALYYSFFGHVRTKLQVWAACV